MRISPILASGIVLPVAAFAASQPTALADVSGGLWEISGAPGSQAPIRQCVADILTLAQFEHRGQNCSRSVLSDGPSSTRIYYKCGAAGFGQTQVDVITPRSLRISTQGISDQLPFNYVLQAHRLGECEKSSASPHH
jgi:hypothetical protein